MDWLAGVPLQGIGVVGLVVILGALIWTGRLWPKSTVDQLIADKDAAIDREAKRGDELQAALEASQTINHELAAQTNRLLITTELNTRILESVRKSGVD